MSLFGFDVFPWSTSLKSSFAPLDTEEVSLFAVGKMPLHKRRSPSSKSNHPLRFLLLLSSAKVKFHTALSFLINLAGEAQQQASRHHSRTCIQQQPKWENQNIMKEAQNCRYKTESPFKYEENVFSQSNHAPQKKCRFFEWHNAVMKTMNYK